MSYRTDSFGPIEFENFERKYVMETKLLGQGAFAKVFRGHLKETPGQKVAVKVISKKKLKNKINHIRNECQILQKLDHPNILKVNRPFKYCIVHGRLRIRQRCLYW